MLLSVSRSAIVLALLTFACGGSEKKPAESPAAPPPAHQALDPQKLAPDLSPVGAPAGLFAVGRWQRPLAQVDTFGGWLGVPGSVLNFVPERYRGLVDAIDQDAPVEFAAVLTRAKGSPVDWVVSLGVKQLAQAVEEARMQGAKAEERAPGVVFLELGRSPSCAVALSLGRSPARLVCSSDERALSSQLPFATRGLPTMALGNRDLELELRLAPLREGFQKELAAAPGFATFFARQLEVDAPRLDRATADAVKALIEEGLVFVEDVDVVSLGGGIDANKGELVLDFDLRFRDQKSSLAALLQDGSRQGPPPESFFALPGTADSGGYSTGFDTARLAGMRSRIAEIVDAALEHAKVGRPSRDRARRIVDTYFQISGARSVASGPSPSGASGPGVMGYTLQIIEHPPAPIVASFTDMNALFADQKLRSMVGKYLALPDKSLPKSSLVPLRGPGIPAGTRAVVTKFPKEFYEGLHKFMSNRGLASKQSRGNEPPELAMVAVPRGQGTVTVVAANASDVTRVLVDFFNGKVPSLKERPELLRLERTNAAGAYFITLGGLVSALAQSTQNPALKASGPAASAPMFLRYEVQKGTSRIGVTVPKSVFAGVQALVPALIK